MIVKNKHLFFKILVIAVSLLMCSNNVFAYIPPYHQAQKPYVAPQSYIVKQQPQTIYYQTPVNVKPRYVNQNYVKTQYIGGNYNVVYQKQPTYSFNEILQSGSSFFGTTTNSLAGLFKKIFSSYGQPSGYILGNELSGSFIAGATYGSGVIYSKFLPSYQVHWSGPSIGFDAGGQASRLMILVYNLHNISSLWRRYAGISGSIYFIAGAGFNVLRNKEILLIPVRTGVGARLGVNMGYLKLTPKSTINPF